MDKKKIKAILTGYYNLSDNSERKTLFDILIEKLPKTLLFEVMEELEDGKGNSESLHIVITENQ